MLVDRLQQENWAQYMGRSVTKLLSKYDFELWYNPTCGLKYCVNV